MSAAFFTTLGVIFGILAAPVLAAVFLVAVGFSVFAIVEIIDRWTRKHGGL